MSKNKVRKSKIHIDKDAKTWAECFFLDEKVAKKIAKYVAKRTAAEHKKKVFSGSAVASDIKEMYGHDEQRLCFALVQYGIIYQKFKT